MSSWHSPGLRGGYRPLTRESVHALVANHTRVPYSSALTDTWDVLSLADEDPAHPGSVLTIYGNRAYPPARSGNPFWEREHLWPVSYGLTDNDPCDYVYTDLHNLRPTEPGLNQARGNKPFGACLRPDCATKPTLDGLGHQNRTWGSGAAGIWEVWPARRGDVARSLLYLDVRYEGGRHVGTLCREPELRLTDNRALIATRRGPVDVAYMGMLGDLVRWHLEDPPDAAERHRNDIVQRYQHNRNPFVDHPEWVCMLWREVPSCVARRLVTPTR